jgi:two-component system nitrogen regulation sensor histidine kinase NtrY
MYTRDLLIRIILLVCLLAASSAACTWMFLAGKIPYGLAVLPLIPVGAGLLIWMFNRTNRKIALFFDSIRNEDFSQTFPENVREKTLRELHRSLNRVNRMFARVREASETDEQFYRSLISHARTGLMAYDRQGSIHEINPAMENILAAYNLRRLSDFDKVDPRLTGLFDHLAPGKPEIMAIPIENEMQQLLFNRSVLQIKDEEYSIVSVENIKSELDHKELDSWVRLIRVLNHEIVNAVTPITTLSSTFFDLFHRNGNLERGQVNDEMIADTARALQNINEHASGLMKFVNSYRQITRLPEPSFRNVPLGEFIRKELFTLQNYSGAEKLETEIDIHPEDVSVYADPELLQRVFSNILINALQSMEAEKTRKLRISAAPNYNNRVVVKIADSGTGIPADIRDQVFVPFFSTKDQGSGIGLSLSRQIMHLHKGEINLDSEEGKGTVVSLLF